MKRRFLGRGAISGRRSRGTESAEAAMHSWRRGRMSDLEAQGRWGRRWAVGQEEDRDEDSETDKA